MIGYSRDGGRNGKIGKIQIFLDDNPDLRRAAAHHRFCGPFRQAPSTRRRLLSLPSSSSSDQHAHALLGGRERKHQIAFVEVEDRGTKSSGVLATRL